jgi:glycosyltransferase involved in cell wall biosynthesis
VLYQPAARVIHLEGGTAGTDETRGFKHHQRINHRKFVERHQAALQGQSPPDQRRLRMARDRRLGTRILVLDHMVPHHDRDAGSARMAAILRILVDLGHAVTFLPDNLARIEPYATELQQMGIEVLYGPMSTPKWLVEHASEFDVAILCRAYFASKHIGALRAAVPRPLTIFDTVDLHHVREERRAELEQDQALRQRAAKTKALELAVMRQSDMIWVTSTHEAAVLRGYATLPPVEVVPTIHHVRADTPGFADRRNLLFIGGFLHPPNEDAVRSFVRTVLPLVIERLPGVQLLIVGANVPDPIRSLASPNVIVLGYVADLVPVFDSCRLSIAPLRYGAGVKGKVTQSLAWGLPVVTTPIGAEGLAIVDREHAMVAAEPAEMARRIVEAYQDEALWQRLADNGRRYVHAHLGYETVKSRLSGLLEGAGKLPVVARMG